MENGNVNGISGGPRQSAPRTSEAYFEEPYGLRHDAGMYRPRTNSWFGYYRREHGSSSDSALYGGSVPPMPSSPPPMPASGVSSSSRTLPPPPRAAAGNGMLPRSLDLPHHNGYANQHESSSSSSAMYRVTGRPAAGLQPYALYPLQHELPGHMYRAGGASYDASRETVPPVVINGWLPRSPQPNPCDYDLSLINNGLHGLTITGENLTGRRQQQADHYQQALDDALRLQRAKGHAIPTPRAGGVPSWRLHHEDPYVRTRLEDVRGRMYGLAKDRDGCKFLRRAIVDGGGEAVDDVFVEVVGASAELMAHTVGNGLMGDLVKLCKHEQITNMLRNLVRIPEDFISIAMDHFGSKVLQLLIEKIALPQQVELLVPALQIGCLSLVNHQSGSFVIKKCVEQFSRNDNISFIFQVVASHSFEIATNSHGCVLIQHCMDVADTDSRDQIVAAICAKGLELAQDGYGNYAVQYVIKQRIPWANADLAARFEGEYLNLSKQKYSSNMVQRCLEIFGPEYRTVIVNELLADPRFDQLLQHPFANYVIQTALDQTEGPVHRQLVEAICPYREQLRDNVYAKQIFLKIFPRRR